MVTKPNAKIAQHSEPVSKADAALSILRLCSKAISVYPKIKTTNIER